MGLHDEAKLDRKFVEFAKLMNIHLNHFPKHEKYGLALEIRRTAYAVYGFIVEAQKRYHKKTALSNLDVEHEKLCMLVRLGQQAIHPPAQPLHLSQRPQARPDGQRGIRAGPCAPYPFLAAHAAPPEGASPCLHSSATASISTP